MTRSTVLAFLLLLIGASPAAAQPWAAKMFKETTHDFGAVARGSKAEYRFEFENIYVEDAHVARVYSSCGCTDPSVTKSTIKTWEKSEIVCKFNTRSFLGRKGATVTVVFDKPYYAEVQLVVNGYIRSDVVLNPGAVNFGDVRQSSTAEKSIQLHYAGRSDWRIIDVRSASDHFEVELTETQRSGGRVDYEMLVRLLPDAPAGYFQDQLTIISDDSLRQAIPLAINGHVVSPLTVSPASLFLGILDPGESVTKPLVVRGTEPFRVLKVYCADGGFKFAKPENEEKTLHVVQVTFTAGDSPGKVAQTIEIETDLGSGVVTKSLATATVREPRSRE
ncbi:MAG: DUF1573 domain-containing protein [Pirellulaceae bacterium]